MGAISSTPAPSDDDFLVEHKTMSSYLHDPPPAEEYTLRSPQKIWRNQIKSVESASVTLKADGKTHCVLADSKGEVQAVLLADAGNHKIHVCTFSPTEKGATMVGQYKERSIYEYGTVMRDIHNRTLYKLKVAGDGGATFRTETCGSCLSKQTACFIKRDGLMCAYLVPTKEKSEKVWDCRVGRSGMEKWLLVALLACFDKFPQMDEEAIRSSSGMRPYKMDRILNAK